MQTNTNLMMTKRSEDRKTNNYLLQTIQHVFEKRNRGLFLLGFNRRTDKHSPVYTHKMIGKINISNNCVPRRRTTGAGHFDGPR